MIRQLRSPVTAWPPVTNCSHNKSKYDLIGDVLITTQSNNYLYAFIIMGKKGKKTQAGKPKKLTPKDIGKRLDLLVKKLEEELEGADLFAPLPPPEDCVICFVPLPRINTEIRYMACCGKDICWACYKENEASIIKQNEEKNAGKKVAFRNSYLSVLP